MMILLLEALCCKENLFFFFLSYLLPISSFLSFFSLFTVLCLPSSGVYFLALTLIFLFLSFLTSACGNPGDKARNSSLIRRRGCWEGAVARGWLPRSGERGLVSLCRALVLPGEGPSHSSTSPSAQRNLWAYPAKNQAKQQCDPFIPAKETTDGKGLMYLASRNILHHNWTLSGHIPDLQRNELFMLKYNHRESEWGDEYQNQGELSLCFPNHSFIHFCQQTST